MSSSSEVRYEGEECGFPTKCDYGLRHLFKWIEDAVEDAIPKLEIIDMDITKTNTEFDELKTLIEDLKEDVARRKIEIRNWKALMSVCLLCVLWLCY
ncbi:hypothetical protein N665_0328s0006 [Sinapis alba]|nr:hypothetical protein N665_0328s0006 [Sinapis alba]